MTAVPAFAVVGHPNKGKSSIVATLAENAEVPISPMPGTTRVSRAFRLSIDGRPLYDLIDTPGFQRPRQVLAWLREHAGNANERAETVRRFIAEHRGGTRFADECQLLDPLMSGAGILYVVDGSVAYGPEYEAEMEILRWTGRPRMALINLIGEADYTEDWRAALDQYFAIVRVFDAARADFARRIDLLRAFAELDENWRGALVEAAEVLTTERQRRIDASAAEIADLLIESLTLTVRRELDIDADEGRWQARLRDELAAALARREQAARARVEAIWAHTGIERVEAGAALLGEELLSETSFRLFGLSRRQLLSTGAAAGAMAGGSIDVLLGGASLLLGAGIGAAIGATSTLLGSGRLAEMRVLGQSVGRKLIEVGPVRDPNLAWVLLSRALLHARLVAERNHARRDALVVATEPHASDSIDPPTRARLRSLFDRLRRPGQPAADLRPDLIAIIASQLGGPAASRS